MLYYFYRSACFIGALRQDIIYQVSGLRSTKISIFFKVFFVTDYSITFALYCSFFADRIVKSIVFPAIFMKIKKSRLSVNNLLFYFLSHRWK